MEYKEITLSKAQYAAIRNALSFVGADQSDKNAYETGMIHAANAISPLIVALASKGIIICTELNSYDRKLADIYLDWVNNFITVDRLAEHYNISPPVALRAIHMGRKIHNKIIANKSGK